MLIELAQVDAEQARRYGVEEGTKLIKYDFVLVPEQVAKALREEEARKAMEGLGQKMRLLDGLPVPDVD